MVQGFFPLKNLINFFTKIKTSIALEMALSKCHKFGSRGYDLAMDAITELERIVQVASWNLQREIEKLKQSNFKDNTFSQNLADQLSSIRADFEILPQGLTDDVNTLSKSVFSITLFG